MPVPDAHAALADVKTTLAVVRALTARLTIGAGIRRELDHLRADVHDLRGRVDALTERVARIEGALTGPWRTPANGNPAPSPAPSTCNALLSGPRQGPAVRARAATRATRNRAPQPLRDDVAAFGQRRLARRWPRRCSGRPCGRLGTTQSAVARLEGGRVSPSLATLRRYAEATGTRLTVGLERAARGRSG